VKAAKLLLGQGADMNMCLGEKYGGMLATAAFFGHMGLPKLLVFDGVMVMINYDIEWTIWKRYSCGKTGKKLSVDKETD
jgi:hypothetical protein